MLDFYQFDKSFLTPRKLTDRALLFLVADLIGGEAPLDFFLDINGRKYIMKQKKRPV